MFPNGAEILSCCNIINFLLFSGKSRALSIPSISRLVILSDDGALGNLACEIADAEVNDFKRCIDLESLKVIHFSSFVQIS